MTAIISAATTDESTHRGETSSIPIYSKLTFVLLLPLPLNESQSALIPQDNPLEVESCDPGAGGEVARDANHQPLAVKTRMRKKKQCPSALSTFEPHSAK